jgi:hypothetical protein
MKIEMPLATGNWQLAFNSQQPAASSKYPDTLN